MKSVLWIVLLAALTLALRGHNLRNTFIGGQIYFVDADCYSRMTRAQIIDQHPGTIVRWHEFENYPTGVMPHTTAPLDYLIVGLKWVLSLISFASESFRTSVLGHQLLDVAGALISPLLGLATVVFLCVWARWWVRPVSIETLPSAKFGTLRGLLIFVSPVLRFLFSSPAVTFAPGFLFAVCPILVHGTILGRPDHQSLLLFLTAIALGVDWVFAERQTLPWAALAGIAWGLALWVSVYEPLILLLGVMIFRWLQERRWGHWLVEGLMWLWILLWIYVLWGSPYRLLILPIVLVSFSWVGFRILVVCRRRATIASEGCKALSPNSVVAKQSAEGASTQRSQWSPWGLKWATLAAILLMAVLIERWHFQLLDEALKQYFTQWGASIAELRHLNPANPTIYSWLGFGCVISPILLMIAARRDRRAISVLGILLLTFGLTWWQIRWGYFLALVFAMSLPWQMAALRWRWAAWLLLLVSLWPTWDWWDKQWDNEIKPILGAERQMALRQLELQQLRKVAETMRSENTQAFLGPWWLSPPLAYWSGQPGVAGSSHESLLGIVDTARFYTAENPADAESVLRARNVEWVVAEDAGRLLSTSKAILASSPSETALAYALAEKPAAVPPFLTEIPLVPKHSGPGAEVSGPQFFRLYRVVKEHLQP